MHANWRTNTASGNNVCGMRGMSPHRTNRTDKNHRRAPANRCEECGRSPIERDKLRGAGGGGLLSVVPALLSRWSRCSFPVTACRHESRRDVGRANHFTENLFLCVLSFFIPLELGMIGTRFIYSNCRRFVGPHTHTHAHRDTHTRTAKERVGTRFAESVSSATGNAYTENALSTCSPLPAASESTRAMRGREGGSIGMNGTIAGRWRIGRVFGCREPHSMRSNAFDEFEMRWPFALNV